jgi:hypothetical protein
MSLSPQTNVQSLNGIIELTDGYITISDGQINNISYLDVGGDAVIEGNLTVSNANINILNNSTLNNVNSSLLFNTNLKSLNCKEINVNKIKTQDIICKNNRNDTMISGTIMSNSISAYDELIIPKKEEGISKIGMISFDENYLYICVPSDKTNVWKKVLLSDL